MAYRVVLTEDAEADLDGFISYLLFEKFLALPAAGTFLLPHIAL